jgi:hypothetical protein
MVVVACGPSSAEIKTAKTASYKAQPMEVLRIAMQTASETYKIGDANEEQLTFMTQPQWYSPEGGRESAGDQDFVQIRDHSIMLSLIVEVVAPAEDRVMVRVTPKTFQHVSGSPKPRELRPDDPNLPGWVTGRAEQLQLDIHKRLQQYAVP